MLHELEPFTPPPKRHPVLGAAVIIVFSVGLLFLLAYFIVMLGAFGY